MRKVPSILTLSIILLFAIGFLLPVQSAYRTPSITPQIFLLLLTERDCNGDMRGTAYIDNCGICVGGNTGQTACAQDCNGDWEGTAYFNTCGCVGGNTGVLSSVTCVTTATDRIWMDRNLGASQVATSSTDTAAYGDLYQWGRLTDGHEKRNSTTTTVLSNTDDPGHSYFILVPPSPAADWRTPQNNLLWQGDSDINNPCPTGFRLPTEVEWQNEFITWNGHDSVGAFGSPLKLTKAGKRVLTGAILYEGELGHYWSSTINSSTGNQVYSPWFNDSDRQAVYELRRAGFSVRCIKD